MKTKHFKSLIILVLASLVGCTQNSSSPAVGNDSGVESEDTDRLQERPTEDDRQVQGNEPPEEIVTQQPNIVEIAVGNENFSTLVTALKAADLVDALQGDGPFTVFAPTNEA